MGVRRRKVFISHTYPHTTHTTHMLTQISKIFDPFMFLSLPLPIKKTRTLIVTLVRTDPAAELYRVRDNLEHQEKVMHV